MENKDFFELIINKVIQGGCLEVMRKIPDNSVDVAFADSPFNLKKSIIVIMISMRSKNI